MIDPVAWDEANKAYAGEDYDPAPIRAEVDRITDPSKEASLGDILWALYSVKYA